MRKVVRVIGDGASLASTATAALPSSAQTAIGDAETGAAVGSIVPVLGTAVGAAIGFVYGVFSGGGSTGDPDFINGANYCGVSVQDAVFSAPNGEPFECALGHAIGYKIQRAATPDQYLPTLGYLAAQGFSDGLIGGAADVLGILWPAAEGQALLALAQAQVNAGEAATLALNRALNNSVATTRALNLDSLDRALGGGVGDQLGGIRSSAPRAALAPAVVTAQALTLASVPLSGGAKVAIGVGAVGIAAAIAAAVLL